MVASLPHSLFTEIGCTSYRGDIYNTPQNVHDKKNNDHLTCHIAETERFSIHDQTASFWHLKTPNSMPFFYQSYARGSPDTSNRDADPYHLTMSDEWEETAFTTQPKRKENGKGVEC